jgi:hypothetical protein
MRCSAFGFKRTIPVSDFHNYWNLTGVIKNGTTNEILTYVTSDVWALLYSGVMWCQGSVIF